VYTYRLSHREISRATKLTLTSKLLGLRLLRTLHFENMAATKGSCTLHLSGYDETFKGRWEEDEVNGEGVYFFRLDTPLEISKLPGLGVRDRDVYKGNGTIVGWYSKVEGAYVALDCTEPKVCTVKTTEGNIRVFKGTWKTEQEGCLTFHSFDLEEPLGENDIDDLQMNISDILFDYDEVTGWFSSAIGEYSPLDDKAIKNSIMHLQGEIFDALVAKSKSSTARVVSPVWDGIKGGVLVSNDIPEVDDTPLKGKSPVQDLPERNIYDSATSEENVRKFIAANKLLVLEQVLEEYVKLEWPHQDETVVYVCKGHMGIQVADCGNTTSLCENCGTQYCEECQHLQSICKTCDEPYCRGDCGDDVDEGGMCEMCKGLSGESEGEKEGEEEVTDEDVRKKIQETKEYLTKLNELSDDDERGAFHQRMKTLKFDPLVRLQELVDCKYLRDGQTVYLEIGDETRKCKLVSGFDDGSERQTSLQCKYSKIRELNPIDFVRKMHEYFKVPYVPGTEWKSLFVTDGKISGQLDLDDIAREYLADVAEGPVVECKVPKKKKNGVLSTQEYAILKGTWVKIHYPHGNRNYVFQFKHPKSVDDLKRVDVADEDLEYANSHTVTGFYSRSRREYQKC
jgi:hypothetical protein